MYSSSKSSYSDDEWLLLLKTEMRRNGPVFYSGHQSFWSGHAFVFDGYTDDDYFHINWGWGGSSNGFYLLPEMGYTSNQGGLFNFKPNRDDELASALYEDAEEMLDATWRDITTSCMDVSVEYSDSYRSLSDELDSLKQETENENRLTEEQNEEVKRKIEELIRATREMHKSALEAENEYLYGLIETGIYNVESLLNACQKSLTVDYAEVADDFTDAFDTIADKFNSLVQASQNAYSNCVLTKEMVDETTIALNEIEEEINTLLQSVREAQREYLYLMVGDDIRDVEELLSTVWTSITTEYPEEAGTFEDPFQTLSSELNELQQQATDAYNDSTIADGIVDEIENRLDEIKTEVASLLESAKELTLFNALMADAEDMQAMLYEVWTIITTEYANTVGDFIEEYKAISDKLAELIEEISETFDNRELTEGKVEESQAKLKVIRQEIADMLTEAREAQEINETTSMEDILFGSDDVIAYNIMGSRVRSLVKGNVYIFRYSDGTSKTVLVK